MMILWVVVEETLGTKGKLQSVVNNGSVVLIVELVSVAYNHWDEG